MRKAAILVFLAMCAHTYAQTVEDTSAQYTITSWTDQDALPSNQIRAIAQDRDGYLWLGTDMGVVRFDGVTFTSWRGKAGLSVQDAEVNALCAGRDGSLWIGYDGRISRLREDDVMNFGVDDGLPRGRLKLLEDHQGIIWVAGIGGVARFRNNHWERVRIGDEPVQAALAIYEDGGNNLWVGTTTAIFVRNAGTEAFTRLEASEPARGFSQDEAGDMWVTDPTRGFRRLAWRENSIGLSSGLDGENGFAVVHDRQGTMWLATQGDGLLRVEADAKSARMKVTRLRAGNGIPNDVVVSLLEDREGNIWVGTQGGLSRLSHRSIVTLSGLGAAGNAARSVLADRDGSMWAATAGGLSHFSHDRRTVYSERDGLPSSDITALHEDVRGVLWVGTDHGIARFANGRFVSVPLPQELRNGPVVTITTDSDGVLWFSHFNQGLIRWKDNKLSEPDPAIAGKLVRALHTDKAGRVWLGLVDGGVAVFDDGGFRFYSERDGLAGGRVDAIFEDGAGAVWVGTPNGLSRFGHDRFETVSVNRLPGKPLSAIVGDERGLLWLRAGSGILRLDHREFDRALADPSYRIQSPFYDASDGLPGLPVLLLPQSVARGLDGRIWIVTASGISVIDPEHLPEHRRLPAVRIEDIAADQRSFNPHPRLRIPARTSRLEIRYTALTLSPPGVRFRYMLDGFDTGWVDAGRGRRAIYTNLPPGPYRFRVATGNMDGMWNEAAATWEFSVAPAFYQTLWFDGVCVMVVGVIIWGGWQWRAARDRAKLAEMRSDFVAGVTHELKTPIAAIRAAGETLMSGRAHGVAQRDYAQLIVREAKRLTRSVDNLLAFSRITDAGAVYCREPLALDMLISESLEEFRPQLVDRGFSVSLDISPTLPSVVGDRRAVSLVFGNLLDNAIRYSGAQRTLDIRLRSTEEQVQLEVSDRGAGIPDDELPHVTRKFYRGRNARSGGSGLGLAIAKRVITEHGGTLTITSTLGWGTTACVMFPANGMLHERPDSAG